MEAGHTYSAIMAALTVALILLPTQGYLANINENTDRLSEPIAQPDGISGVFFAQTGSYVEHTPSIIQCSNGTFFLAYESASSISGKFTINMTWSTNGIYWNPDWVAITSAGTMGNRHPTLIQRQDGLLMMAYFSDRTAAYRVYTATSTNGRTWTESGALALQNPAVNPFLIQTDAGTYAMSYQRYGSASDGSYFASSANGIAWTAPTTRVTSYSLPRLTERVIGGYLMTYQGGTTGSTFDIRFRTSADGTTWSAETRLTFTGNSHDSFPIKLVNDTYTVFFCTSISGGGYDLYRKWSADLVTWSANQLLPTSNTRFDTEPHPCQLASNQTFLLSWGYESSGAIGDYENVDIGLIWIEDITPLPTYDIPLVAGWNLVSFPLVVAITSIDAVLSPIDGHYEVVKAYNASDIADHWKTYRPGGPSEMNDLENIDNKIGFWIKISSYCVLQISGTAPTTTDIQLRAGWNLVGYPCGSLQIASDALAGTGADIVSSYDEGNGVFTDYTDITTTTMRPSHGYWVHVNSDITWSADWA